MDAIDKAEGPASIGPFRVVRRLGAGGMAEAFEALRTGPGGFEQRVCVKRVLPAYSTDDELTRLFVREARLAAALSHRNITRVVDFGEDGGCHYLALELVEGVDLRRLLKCVEHRRVSIGVAALIGMEVAEALDHAHTRSGKTGGVVHRDVSPANILVSVDGDVKLTDFGISKALNDAPITRSDFVRGNVWYMAPEQIAGSRSDPRSDLFSLGVVLYQCVAGRRPYHGPTDLAAMMALSEGRRVPLREAAPFAPESIVAIIERLLADDPAGRYATAGALVEALSPLADVTGARRELRALVRQHRHARPKRRAAVPVAPVTLDLIDRLGTDPAGNRSADSPAAIAPAPIAAGVDEPATVRSPRPRRHTPPESERVAAPSEPRRGSSVGALTARPVHDPGAEGTTPRRAARGEDAASHAAERTEGVAPRSAKVPSRWKRYALAPGAWASVDRAAEQRRRDGRPLPSPDPVELPARSGLWWTALAVVVLATVGLVTCVLTLVA